MKRSINRAAPALPPMPALVSVHRLRLLELLLATRLFASVGVEPVFTENISDAERVAVMGLFGATVTICWVKAEVRKIVTLAFGAEVNCWRRQQSLY